MKKFLITFIILFLDISYGAELPEKKLSTICSEFQQTNGEVALVIMSSRKAKVEYIFNRKIAVKKKFPPGSLAKIWSAVVLLENPSLRFNKSFRLNCQGRFYIPENIKPNREDLEIFNIQKDSKGRKYINCSVRAGHGNVSLYEGLIHSCNFYFLSSGKDNPEKIYNKMVDLWHLDENSGARGKGLKEYPSIKHRRKRLSRLQALMSIIGEGGNIRLSPLKVGQICSAFFDKTPLLSPYEYPYKNAEMRAPLKISPASRNYIYSALQEVVTRGTLKGVIPSNKRIKVIAGKTGSGTHFRKKYLTHGWNVIYFRYKNQNHVMVTFVFKGTGGKEAKKLSKMVLNAL